MDISRDFSSSATTALLASGLGACATFMGAPEAAAAVKINITATGSHITASPGDGGSSQSVYLDVDGDSSVDAWFLHVGSRWFFMTITNSMEFAATKTGTGTFGLNYVMGFPTIPGAATLSGHLSWDGAATVFDAGDGHGWGSWSNGMGYIGVRIPEAPDVYSYAWIQITPNAAGTEIVFTNWSSAAPGGSGGGGGGPNGAVGTPEPVTGGLALLALGAAGVMRHRRQRQAS